MKRRVVNLNRSIESSASKIECNFPDTLEKSLDIVSEYGMILFQPLFFVETNRTYFLFFQCLPQYPIIRLRRPAL